MEIVAWLLAKLFVLYLACDPSLLKQHPNLKYYSYNLSYLPNQTEKPNNLKALYLVVLDSPFGVSHNLFAALKHNSLAQCMHLDNTLIGN